MEEILKSLATTFSKLPTAEQFLIFCKKAMDTIAQSEIKLFQRLDARLAQIKNGKDGRDGTDGKDGKPGAKGDKGEPGPIGRSLFGGTGADGVAGKDGSPDTPIEVRDKLETLKDEERLDASAIKNLPKAVERMASYNVLTPHALLNHSDVDFSGILSGQSIQWNGTRWIPYTPGSGSGLNYLAATGTVDDSNVTFTFVSIPTLVAVNGALYKNGGGVTIVGTTATLDSPAGIQGSVYGLG